MNKWQTLGIVGGFFAFFVAAIIFNQLITSDTFMSLAVGAVAAFATYKFCDKKDRDERKALMNPDPQTWPVPLPVAWASVKDVLYTTGVETRESGKQLWKIQREDQSRGIIQAQLDFAEGLAGSMGQKEMVPRSIGLTVVLAPANEEAGTKVTFSYNVYSKVSIHTVKNVIRQTNSEFPKVMLANKEQQGL